MGLTRSKIRSGNPKILLAARALSKKLDERGIAHALIGGLAVGQYGYDRATSDADFLISGDAESEIGGDMLGGEVSGKTIVFKGVPIDLLFPSYEQSFLEADIRRAVKVGSLPVIPKEVLIYMKLVAGRMRDNGDIVELLKRGKITVSKVFAYLKKHRPDLVEDFEAMVLQAEHEPR